MVARRLLIVLLVLLMISSAAALLAPPQETRDATTTTTKPAAPRNIDAAAAARPRLLAATIDADQGKVSVVPLQRGEQLALRVRSKRPDQVEIPAFGEIAAVSLDAPASFDLLLERTGSFAVRLVEARRLIGRLKVEPARRTKGAKGA